MHAWLLWPLNIGVFGLRKPEKTRPKCGPNIL